MFSTEGPQLSLFLNSFNKLSMGQTPSPGRTGAVWARVGFLRRNLDERRALPPAWGAPKRCTEFCIIDNLLPCAEGPPNCLNTGSHKPRSTPDNQANPVRDPKDKWSRDCSFDYPQKLFISMKKFGVLVVILWLWSNN